MDALGSFLGFKSAAPKPPTYTDGSEFAVFNRDVALPPGHPIPEVPPVRDSPELRASESQIFQSGALKDAAEYAAQLEKNPHAKDILDSRKRELAVKLEEQTMQVRQMEVMKEQEKTNRVKVTADEERKLNEQRVKDQRNLAQYNDQLARKREEDLANAEIQKNQRIEEEKRRTNQQKIEGQMQVAKQQAVDKAMAKAKVQRENHDLELEKIREKGKQERQTRMEQHMETVKTTKEMLVNFGSAMMEKKNMTMAVGGLAATFAAYFTLKGSSNLVFRIISDRMRKPDIVMETSRIMPLSALKNPIQTAKIIKWRFNKEDPRTAFKGVILAPEIEKKMLDIALLAKNSRQMKLPYNNLLLHGPPGTGKTMFAQLLARNSGMDYAILSGGHMSQLGDGGVQEVDQLFSWAKTSRHGIILFMDEAESFLAKRYTGSLDKANLATLSAFLAHTGSPNDKFMMVLTSNLPTVFDDAVLSRVHKSVQFPAPAAPERHRLMLHYFLHFVMQPAAAANSRIKLSPELMEAESQAAILKEIADMGEGMTGRDIATLCRGFQQAAHLDSEGRLTRDMVVAMAREALTWTRARNQWKDIPVAAAGMSATVIAASQAAQPSQ